jgi:pyridoxine 4-dehydrogenase
MARKCLLTHFRKIYLAYHYEIRPENLRRSVLFCAEKLGKYKRIDLWEPARVDNKVPLEDQIKELVKLRSEGHFDYIGLSECSADTLRKAHAVCVFACFLLILFFFLRSLQIAPGAIAMAEIEINPITYEEETKKGMSFC